MIAAKCFTKAWLDECREKVGRADPGLLEKSIYAFDLVGCLAAEGLPFVFKGGTALLLLLDNFRRLSIDVDIACPLPPDEVSRVVAEVVRKGRFTGVGPDERDPARLPKRHHYALTFTSIVNPRMPATLQLDVLEDDAHYPHTRTLPLQSRLVVPSKDVRITVPTSEGILADKLTAFAPKTIGVPYNAFKASLKITKHAADIGELFMHARDGKDLVQAYGRVFAAENSYRANGFTMSEALDDTIETALLLSSINVKGYRPSPESAVLLPGVAQVDSHMIGPRYTLDHAKIAAARAAHLAAVILSNKAPDDLATLRFDGTAMEAIKDVTLDGRFAILNRLKRINPEAFYRWTCVRELLRTGIGGEDR
jgi:hypothetical protein